MLWLQDLKKVWSANESSKLRGDTETQTLKLLEIFKDMYTKVSLRVLDQLQRPFIFAYSAQVDQEIIQRTSQVGFDGCLETKLGVTELREVMDNYVSRLCSSTIDSSMTNC